MKATLEFNIPEESDDFQITVKAQDYACAWNYIKEHIRCVLKYKNPTKSQIEILEEIRNLMIEEERDRKLPIEY